MNTTRVEIIRKKLEEAFAPTLLEISDDSHLHKGHKGAEGGAGHYTVTLSASSLKKLPRIEAHRQVYAALANLIPDEIHALKILLKS